MNKKAFISYSWDSEEHKEWVLKISTELRGHGVDVILDQWDARLGNNLPDFIGKGLSTSNIVICICSEQYVKKANENDGGAGYETRIIASHLLNSSNKFFVIPIIKNNNSTEKVPICLMGLKYLDFDNRDYSQCYYELLERIYEEDVKKKPPIGTNPFESNDLSNKITVKNTIEKNQFQNPQLEGRVSFDYTKNDGLFTIGVGNYSFVTSWSTCGENSIHCYRDYVYRLGYNPSFHIFPEPHDFLTFDYSSRARSINVGEVALLENDKHKFAAIKVTKVIRREADIDHLLEFDYKIYKETDIVRLSDKEDV